MLRTKRWGSWGGIGIACLLTNAIIAQASFEKARQGLIKSGGCSGELASLFLAGSFTMPGSAERMGLWIGKHNSKDLRAVGLVGRSDKEASCEAVCKIIRFERFRKDAKPALMELECEGARVKTLRMPLHVHWSSMGTTVRLGSSLYGIEQAPLELLVNRYNVPIKAAGKIASAK